MTITAKAAQELAKRLIADHEHGHSWRAIADTFPKRADGSQVVKAGTLCRIATEAGAWLPRNREILIALGLIQPRKQEYQPEWLKRRKKAIRKMARETRKALKAGVVSPADLLGLDTQRVSN